MTPPLFDGLDACVVSDALDSLGIADQVADGLAAGWEGGRVCGPAITMRLADGPTPPDAPAIHLGARAISSAQGGEVIVVDNAGRSGMGSWGGLLSRAAQLAGVAGVVSDGAIRDLDEARELEFPVFGRGGAVRTARGRIHEVAVGTPVTVCGVIVTPGDWVIADATGVVFVPAGCAAAVAAAAREFVARENDIVGRIEAGESLASVFGLDYEAMLEGQ